MTEVTESKKSSIPIPAIRVKLTQEEKDMKLVKGRFIFHEAPGGSAPLPYRRYKREPSKVYKMQDGQIYEIPYGLARHIRTGCGVDIHGHILDSMGNPDINRTASRRERMSFEPLVFNVDGEFFV